LDFQITEEQKILKETIRKIAKKEFEPKAAEVDEKEEFPWDNKRILAENGLLGINCPKAYGGSGESSLTLALVIEELARVCASTAHIISTQSLVVDAFVLKGAGDQKTRWLKPLAEGSQIGAFAMTKWFASDSAMEITTRAVQLFGGYGYVREYPVERMMRDAKITQIYEGTNEILRNVVSRQLLG